MIYSWGGHADRCELLCAGGGEEGEQPTKGLFGLPFMRRAHERRRAQAQADAAAMLRELEAADARAGAGSDGEDDWTAAEPAERSGRWRFGSGRQQPQDQVRMHCLCCSCTHYQASGEWQALLSVQNVHNCASTSILHL